MKKICKNCKKEFTTYPCRGYEFCSLKCYSDFKRKENELSCSYCGKKYSTPPSKRKRSKNSFCSAQCYYKFNRGKNNYQWREREKITCLNCGKEFFTVVSPSQKGRKKFCSRSCLSIYTIKNHLPRKETLPERIVKRFLIKNKIPFKQQVPVENIGVVDFVIGDILAIECDGDYWHSLPATKKRDWKKNLLMRIRNYPLFRFSESQIKKDSYWKDKILYAWGNIQNPEIIITKIAKL